MIKDFKRLEINLNMRLRTLCEGCEKVFVALSGGIDSAVVTVLACKVFGPENVVAVYRDIRSNPKHLEHAELLRKQFGFHFWHIDLNDIYDSLIQKVREQAVENGFLWADENTPEAELLGFEVAYESFKSVLTTPLADFISKMIDHGRGRILGTGNADEDQIMRYYNKRGDGAVDNNILSTLTKAEVRQLALYWEIPKEIVYKTPSADLRGIGDEHNDENQLTQWAHERGYKKAKLTYGNPDEGEGTIAWLWREDRKTGVITGIKRYMNGSELLDAGYSEIQVDNIRFAREMEKKSRHKVEPTPGGLDRDWLERKGIVE